MSFQLAFNAHDQLIKNLEEFLVDTLNFKSKTRELRLISVSMPETKQHDDLDSQKKAKLTGLSYSSPIKANLELYENGKLLDRSNVKVMDLPQVTLRGTYIVGGNEYAFPMQKRLIPGIYTKEHDDGKISSWFNSSKGSNMAIALRTSGDFVLEIGASQINFYSIITGLGATDAQLKKIWGDEVYQNNKTSRGAQDQLTGLKKLYDKLHYESDEPALTKDIKGYRDWILNYFETKSEFDADNVGITLGQKFSRNGVVPMLAATSKILSVSREEKEGDNRESLIHNNIFDLSDFVIERMGQTQYKSKMKRSLSRNIDRYDKINQIIQKDIFQSPLESTFTQTSLSRMPKQNNPMDQISNLTEITVMGEGGIGSSHAVTRDVRAIDPSHFGFVDPAHTPEGQNIGTTLHIVSGVRKIGKNLVNSFYDVSNGKTVDLSPRQVFSSVVAFPEYYKKGKLIPGEDKLVKVMASGEIKKVEKSEVKYAMMRATDMFGVNTLGVPFLGHNNGTRVMTAAKMQAQAKPLKYREAPLIQSAISEDSDTTIEQLMGMASAPRSPVDGVVNAIKEHMIIIKGKDGELHEVNIPKDFWMNENNYVNSEAVIVAVGDKVKKDQSLVDTNYTKDGILALGINLKTAYVSYKGYNHEDGVVISESGAEKLTSMHGYQYQIPIQPTEVTEKKKFIAYFPAAFTSDQLNSLDENGVVKKGAKLQKGDPLVIKMKKIEEDTTSKTLQNISRLLVQDFRNNSALWDKSSPGVVSEIYMRNKEILVIVKTEEKARIGDKIVGRYGNKGTITTILTDEEMPKDADGEVMDLLLDPTGTPGRMNIGQILETTASNIAEKTGKTYVAKPFGKNQTESILKELKQHGLKDHGSLFDKDGEVTGVLHGKQYIMKLEHQVDKKLSARAAGPDYPYSLSGQPGRGDHKSGRAVGLGELYALLSHGADANIKEMYTFKGDKQWEIWRAIENGTFVPAPEVPASSERFVQMLRGMGVNLVEDKNMVKMTPFLDRDVRKISNGEIKESTTLRAKDLKEEKGGLFDFKVTGGVIGDKWGHIELAEPMPHPTFEKSILSVTRLKKADYLDVIAGKKGILSGEVVSADKKGAIVGGEGIKSLLKKIDSEARMKEIKEISPTKKGSDLNKLHKEYRVLKNFTDNKIDLSEMVVSTMPIMPPKFRPIVELPTGDISVADVNEHYRATMLMNDQMKNYVGRPGLADEAIKVRKNLYDGMSGVMGTSKGLVEKPDIKGIAMAIAGSSPKYGLYHSKLLKRRQETSGTAVVGPEPDMDMDSMGIPENMAWEIFKPYVVKDLKSSGLTTLKAKEEIENRSPMARHSLVNTMDSRYVIANRAPTLHRGSIMAFKPKLVSGSALKIPVEVLSGFNADFDGDTFGVFVPSSPEAVEEAKKMLPSANLYSPGTIRSTLSVSLGKEYMMGLYKLTRPVKTTAKSYRTIHEAIKDAEQKKIAWDDVISVTMIGRTTAGKIRVNAKIPKDLQDYQMTLTEKEQDKKLVQIEKKYGPDMLKTVMNDWKLAGRIYVYQSGSSLLLSDFKMLTKERNQLYRKADQDALRIRNSKMNQEDKDKKLIEIYSKVDSKIMGMALNLPANSTGKTNNLSNMINSGLSKPGPSQLKQLVGNVGLMLDHRQKVMPEPVRGNYAEGLSSSDFFQHMYAQRKGMIDKSQSVSGPGMLSKELTNSTTTQKITMIDCRTLQGRMEDVDRHILDRFLASDVAGFKRNSAVDENVLDKLQKLKINKVKIRSLLTCAATVGVCAYCFGIDEHGKLPNIGKNVGISEIQAITERSIQLPMKSFHSGGVATAEKGVANAFDRALQIFHMPENIKGKATLSEKTGIVSNVRKSGYGGNIVTVNGLEHRIPAGLELKVKMGDMVMQGDPLSAGIVKPQELMKLKGLEAVQTQMQNDLNTTFSSAGVKLHKRTYEVPVKMLTENVRITDTGDSDFSPGDYATLAKITAWNNENKGKRPIKFYHDLAGSLMAPMQSDDFAKRMALNRISQTIQEGAGMGYQSDRKGPSPFINVVLGPGTRIPTPNKGGK
jgi:DNA-directed RNA polymerase subunit beta'